MTVGLLLTALGLGLRHGVDWDHIAAIADLSSSAESRRRGFVLSCLYALGHGAIVMVLGLAAIAFGSAIPAGIDDWMGRVVGLTLVALGLWIVVDLVRKGSDFRLRSRWILIFSGTFAGLRRVRDAQTRRRVAVTHDHEHEHTGDPDASVAGVGGVADASVAGGGGGVADASVAGVGGVADASVAGAGDRDASVDHDDVMAHDHSHCEQHRLAPAPVSAGVGARGAGWWGSRHRHRHPHSHELALSDQATAAGNGTAAGIGLLHGIGVESPTQIAVFVASTSVAGAGPGIALLVAWVVGLLLANAALAGLAAGGLLQAERNFTLYATIAVVVAAASVAMGTFLLIGVDVLPSL